MSKVTNKAVPALFVLLVLAYVINQPHEAAHTFAGIWTWLGHAGTAFGRFINAL